ncbi:MAG: glycosyltransferase family 4 protein [Candidatus Poribacteria bacterium]|nr:glycosyltransferase family 4 protein [Candidatus Poribacteria bacterium]
MLKSPTKTHHLHKFRYNDSLYIADLDVFRLVEVNQIAWDAVELSPTLETEALITHLSQTYPRELVLETLELLRNFQDTGLIFYSSSRTPLPDSRSDRLKIYVPQGRNEWFLDPESISSGTNVALYHTIQSLSKFADIYLSGEPEGEITQGVYTIRLSAEELQESPRRFNQRLRQFGASGILAYQNHRTSELVPFFREVNLPIVVQNHAPRGHAGQAINATLLHHALMHPYDAFTSPSDSVAKFYSKFVGDTRHFHTNPNGVDSETFKPLNKSKAKATIANIVQDKQIEEKLTVGFLSRFQPEKGAHIFIQLAEMHPELLFLVGGKFLLRPTYEKLPDNLIYVGFLPRKQLPTLYNAFDIYCFPSMAAEETFGLTLLEAMACGVPPVVPQFDGLPDVVGDAGIIVPAEEFSEDMAGFAAYVSATALSKGITSLLENDFRHKLGQRARDRAVAFTWDDNAKRLIQLFEKLNRIKQNQRTSPDLSVAFVPHFDAFQNQLESRALLLNLTPFLETPLQLKRGYIQTMEEGLALTLLKRRTPRQVEAVLTHILGDASQASKIVKRVQNFLNTLA